jgi:hypothetical protein
MVVAILTDGFFFHRKKFLAETWHKLGSLVKFRPSPAGFRAWLIHLIFGPEAARAGLNTPLSVRPDPAHFAAYIFRHCH